MGGRALRWVLLTYAWLGCSTSITSVSTTSTTHAIEHVDAVASCSAPDPNVSLVGAHFDTVSVPWYPLTVVRNGSFVGVYDTLLATVARRAGFTFSQRPPRNAVIFKEYAPRVWQWLRREVYDVKSEDYVRSMGGRDGDCGVRVSRAVRRGITRDGRPRRFRGVRCGWAPGAVPRAVPAPQAESVGINPAWAIAAFDQNSKRAGGGVGPRVDVIGV